MTDLFYNFLPVTVTQKKNTVAVSEQTVIKSNVGTENLNTHSVGQFQLNYTTNVMLTWGENSMISALLMLLGFPFVKL